jgi:CDGSH-type Zn-finger protein/ferredoxin
MKNKITVLKNGPLEVNTDNIEFIQEGKELTAENPSYLCRCGNSANKPWCDGTHKKSGFNDKREITKENIQVYEGEKISINFNRSICAGAAKCVQGLKSVFTSGNSDNWIDPNGDSNENIIKTISTCPSGALSYSIGTDTFIDEKITPRINILKNGPYSVEGIRLENAHRPTHFSETKYTLCRCGHSKNKPYCDYSHAEVHWDDEA